MLLLTGNDSVTDEYDGWKWIYSFSIMTGGPGKIHIKKVLTLSQVTHGERMKENLYQLKVDFEPEPLAMDSTLLQHYKIPKQLKNHQHRNNPLNLGTIPVFAWKS
jgi:hypothetical protein